MAIEPGTEVQASLPVLDVSIVTHNSAGWLEAFFASLAAQQFPLDHVRIWVRENGSTDGTREALRLLAATWETRCAGFRVDLGENIGFGRAHNANLARSGGPFFLVTNVDLRFEPDALVTLVSAALSDTPATASWEMRQKPFEHPKLYDPVTLATRWSSHACVLFRRQALLAVGGYEELLFLYGEDVELSYRLRDQGYILRYVPSAVCWHESYSMAGQRKRAQFMGSKLANLLLRLRYGSALNLLAVPVLYLGLWCVPPRVERYWRGVADIGWNLVTLGPRFLRTRRHGAYFPFRLWDYERTRAGAFYLLSPSEGERPLVSVITRTYSGRTSKLEAALYSLANQTHPNIEIVVVEDGSNEAHDLVERFRGEGSIMRVHYQAIEKSGRCRAGNVGLAAAQGEFVCFLDDDDLFYADHLEVLVAALLAHPAAGAAYSLAFEVPGDATAASGQDGDASSFRVSVHQPFSRALLWDHNYLPIQSVLFRRSLYLEKGGLDEELDNLEDWNLWIRYSLDVDFFFVEKVTSLYSVPEEGEDAYQRFLRLEDYRARANEKNGQLRVTLSPTEVLAYAQEIERYKTVFALRRSMLRSLALRLPFAGPLFHVLRRAGHALTRRA